MKRQSQLWQAWRAALEHQHVEPIALFACLPHPSRKMPTPVVRNGRLKKTRIPAGGRPDKGNRQRLKVRTLRDPEHARRRNTRYCSDIGVALVAFRGIAEAHSFGTDPLLWPAPRAQLGDQLRGAHRLYAHHEITKFQVVFLRQVTRLHKSGRRGPARQRGPAPLWRRPYQSCSACQRQSAFFALFAFGMQQPPLDEGNPSRGNARNGNRRIVSTPEAARIAKDLETTRMPRRDKGARHYCSESIHWGMALWCALVLHCVALCGAGEWASGQGAASPLSRGARGRAAARRITHSSEESSSPFHAPPSVASGAGWDSEGFSLPSGMQEEGYGHSGWGAPGGSRTVETPARGDSKCPGRGGIARRMFGDDEDDTGGPMALDTPQNELNAGTRAQSRAEHKPAWRPAPRIFRNKLHRQIRGRKSIGSSSVHASRCRRSSDRLCSAVARRR